MLYPCTCDTAPPGSSLAAFCCVQAKAKQASAGVEKRGGSAVTSAAKRAKGMSADDQPSTPNKRAKSEAQPFGKRQVRLKGYGKDQAQALAPK